MSNLVYESTLYHHGIKGQKWGVRRFQNKDGSYTSVGKKHRISNKEMRQDRNQFQSKLEKNADYSKANKLRNEAYELAKKYDLAMDDGGGGRPGTPKNAGKRYMQLHSDADFMEQKIKTDIGKQTAKYMIDKYGKERVDRFNTAEGVSQAAKLIGVLLAPVATIGVVDLMIHR